MRERLLAEFLDGRASAWQVREDLANAYIRTSYDVWVLNVEFADQTYVVTRRAMLRVCEAVLAGEFEPSLLEPIGDCLMMSESFQFEEADRELLADVANCWGTPEHNDPLDVPYVEAYREWLTTGESPFGESKPS